MWYRDSNATKWINPRKPPKECILTGRYVECKYFQQGEMCVETPCKFAHGRDELEIWKLCHYKGNFPSHTSKLQRVL